MNKMLALVFLALSLTVHAAVNQDQKLPIPSSSDLKKAEAEIRAVFKDEFAKKDREAKREMAQRLLVESTDEKNTTASRYAVLLLSRDLAVESLDIATLFKSIESIENLYDVGKSPLAGATFTRNVNALKIEALNKAQKIATSTEDAGSLGDAYFKVAEEALREKVFEDALAAAQVSEKYGRSSKSPGLSERASILSKEISELWKEDEEFGKAVTSKSDDAAARLVKGRYTLFVIGEEKTGIDNLLGCSDDGLKAVAKMEASGPLSSDAMLPIAEAWFALSGKETSPLNKRRYKERAIRWFERALKDAGGIQRIKIEKRLSELMPTSVHKNRQILDLGGGMRMELIYIKQGTFTMGGKEAPGPDFQVDEKPEHKVTITKGFSLGKNEVTRGQFATFIKATGYKTEAEKEGKAWGKTAGGQWQEIAGNNWLTPATLVQADDHPVVCVSWNDAKAFCEWGTKKTGRMVMLPTEAEWEYGCRAGTSTKWSFGDNETAMGDFGWFSGNSGSTTHPVGQKKPNAWGLYDMHGNVWEWCGDWAEAYTSGGVDPTGPLSGDRRILRGGDWTHDANFSRSAFRYRVSPSHCNPYIGFRVVVH